MAAQHFATCRGDGPGPSLAVAALLFHFVTLLFFFVGEGRIEIQQDEEEGWSSDGTVGFLFCLVHFHFPALSSQL